MTDAEIQTVSAEIFAAARDVVTVRHSDMNMRDGWIAVVTAALSLIAMYIDAVDPADRDEARKTVIEALTNRIGELSKK